MHQELTGVTRSSSPNVHGEGERVQRHKGEHQKKDSFSSSGLRGGSGAGTVVMENLEPLFVPVQDENHGATGPEHDPLTQNIREGQQGATCYMNISLKFPTRTVSKITSICYVNVNINCSCI